jgi:RNA polymerase sigma-70 factor (ECF subfamily)
MGMMGANAMDDTHSGGTATTVDRARRGDTAAFEALYREHVDRIHALCLRLTADPRRAEEATQDAFVRAWQKLDQFRGESHFGSWLYRLATNVVFMEYRSRKRRETRVQPVPDLRLVEGSPSRPASARAEPLDLERAIAQLPTQARQVFVLHDVEGFRHGEIAEQMGIAVGTSKAHLHRARKMLQETLGGAA